MVVQHVFGIFSEENKRWNKSAEQMTFLGARIMKK